MTEIPSLFVRATSMLAPSLLLLLSATGVHADIVSAPPITIHNEAQYLVSGDCTYIEGEVSTVTVTFSYSGQVIDAGPVDCTPTGDWSVEADITGFGSGFVDDNGILKSDVTIQAVYTHGSLEDLDPEIYVYRNSDASRPPPELVISLAENRTVVGKEFQASTDCGANQIILDANGLLTVHETDCARMVLPLNPANPDKTLALTDTHTGASGACEFDTLTMNGAGDIRITVDPQATDRCLDDKDGDGILDLQDPEPGRDINNGLCVDSQRLIDHVALTEEIGDLVETDTGSVEYTCKANESITVQGVSLPGLEDIRDPGGYVDVCYEAGQFVRFVQPSLPDLDPETNEPKPSFSVPLGATFSVAQKGSCPS